MPSTLDVYVDMLIQIVLADGTKLGGHRHAEREPVDGEVLRLLVDGGAKEYLVTGPAVLVDEPGVGSP